MNSDELLQRYKKLAAPALVAEASRRVFEAARVAALAELAVLPEDEREALEAAIGGTVAAGLVKGIRFTLEGDALTVKV